MPISTPPAWSYLRRGGCENLTFEVSTAFENIPAATYALYDCRLMIDNGSGMAVWWRGYVSDIRPAMGEPDKTQFTAAGWIKRLEHLSVVGLGFPILEGGIVWKNVDASRVARNLIDRGKAWVVPTYDLTDTAPNSGYVLPEIEFNGSIADAIRLLAEIAGNRDFGIDAGLVFHFRPKSTTLGKVFVPGDNVAGLGYSATAEGMVNRIYLFGANSGRYVIEDFSSLAVDQSQTVDNASVSFGKATTRQKIIQTFTPTKGTLSEIEVKLSAVGFSTANLISDPGMENAGVANWPLLTSAATPAEGDWSPESIVIEPYSGGP